VSLSTLSVLLPLAASLSGFSQAQFKALCMEGAFGSPRTTVSDRIPLPEVMIAMALRRVIDAGAHAEAIEFEIAEAALERLTFASSSPRFRSPLKTNRFILISRDGVERTDCERRFWELKSSCLLAADAWELARFVNSAIRGPYLSGFASTPKRF
jgi:hypothetical protein